MDTVIRLAQSPEHPSTLEVNGHTLSIAAKQTVQGRCLRVEIRAGGPSAYASEVVVLRDDDAYGPRAVAEICEAARRVLDLASIDRSKLAQGGTAAIASRHGRAYRVADYNVLALAWAAVGASQLEGGG